MKTNKLLLVICLCLISSMVMSITTLELEQQLDYQKQINQLNWQTKVAKAKAALAKAEKECQDNYGCGNDKEVLLTNIKQQANTVTALSKEVKTKVKKSSISILNNLKIKAITNNNTVIFRNVVGQYKIGDEVLDGFIIKAIEDDVVTLIKDLVVIKISLDWTREEI